MRRYVESFNANPYNRLSSRITALVDGLLTTDTTVRLGSRRRGVESVRIQPFFWGLSWEALESTQLTPPHASYCEAKAAKFTVGSDSTAFTTPPSPRRRSSTKKDSQDAATRALDKMFDFSNWGAEME